MHQSILVTHPHVLMEECANHLTYNTPACVLLDIWETIVNVSELLNKKQVHLGLVVRQIVVVLGITGRCDGWSDGLLIFMSALLCKMVEVWFCNSLIMVQVVVALNFKENCE